METINISTKTPREALEFQWEVQKDTHGDLAVCHVVGIGTGTMYAELQAPLPHGSITAEVKRNAEGNYARMHSCRVVSYNKGGVN